MQSETTDSAVNTADAPTQVAPAQTSSPSRACSATTAAVYAELSDKLLPRWLRTLGRAPWLRDCVPTGIGKSPSDSALFDEQTTTLAIALVAERDPNREHAAYIRELIRASLIHWQLSLRSDGRPIRRPGPNALHGAVADSVVRLLGETIGFQTPTLLTDIERHMNWLSEHEHQDAWPEAATISALSQGALLVRSPALLATARRRLGRLLARQDEDGWFPERGGFNSGRMSLTLDALARLYRDNDWRELRTPLHRALRLVSHLTAPDPNPDVRGSFLPSPHGVELLAAEFPEAATLAILCRRWCHQRLSDGLDDYDDRTVAFLGVGLGLAAVHATNQLTDREPPAHRQHGRTRFEGAGVSVFSNHCYHAVVNERKGGALHVTWRNGAASLDDEGIVVIHPHAMRTSAHNDPRNRASADESSVTCSGVLRRPAHHRRRSGRWLRRLIRAIGRAVRPESRSTSGYDKAIRSTDRHSLTHDRFMREITFGDDWIRIKDTVHCRFPCDAVICQAPTDDLARPPGLIGPSVQATHPPIFTHGGRHVEITRVYRNGVLSTGGG